MVSCSIASTWCIVDSVRRSIVTACSVSGGSSFSSRRVPDCSMSIAGQTRRSASLRSSTSSMLPVPLNSWKISSSMRLPVSISAVPTIGQRAAFFERPGRGEQLLRDVHGLDVDAAGHRAAGVADPLVERAGQARDRVEQQEHVLAHFGQPLAALDDELRQADVAFDVAVEAEAKTSPLTLPLHVGDFFRPLVDRAARSSSPRDSSSRSPG